MQKIIKILVIDKEEIILKSFKKALKSDANIEYTITTCNTALEGLKLIRSDTFDIVFVDLVLPGMNGIEVLRRIKNIYPAVFVIIMSGFVSVGINPESNGKSNYSNNSLSSAAGFLTKPFTTEELKSLVSKIIVK
ncbi:MAG: response regulator [Ignavibacteriaceae bacterium]|jgi:DNA-binding NtrC family response regulator